jgi:hypothetical protein
MSARESRLQELMAASRAAPAGSKETSRHAQDFIAAADENLSDEGQRRSSEALPKQRKLSSDLHTPGMKSGELPPLQEGCPASNNDNLGSHDGSIGQSWVVQGPKYEQIAVEEPEGRCCLYWLPFRVRRF